MAKLTLSRGEHYHMRNCQANICLDEDVLKTSFVIVLRRRLQEVDNYIRLGHISSRRLQDVFMTSSRCLRDVILRCLQGVLKTSSSKHYQDIFKTYSKRLQDVFQRCFQDVFKKYHQVKLFSVTRLPDSTNFRDVLQGRLSSGGFAWVTILRNLW